MKIKSLEWRKPEDNGQDFGFEDCSYLADGIGGIYSIEPTTLTKLTGDAGFLLWWAYDPFIFEEHATEASAKASAEAHWQKTVSVLLEGE